MDYRIETKESFRIVGISRPLCREPEKNFETMPQMWQEAAGNGTIQKLEGMMDALPMGLLGISTCGGQEQWKYFIAVSSTKPAEEFEEYTIPAATWAVFSGTGSNEAQQKQEKRMIAKWLLDSAYQYGEVPDIEVYLKPDPQNAQYEVWIPMIKG